MSQIFSWTEIHHTLLQLQLRDARSYRTLAIACFLLSIPLLFVFVFASLFLLILSGYMYFYYRKNLVNSFSFVIHSTVIRKECYYYPTVEPDGVPPPPEPSVFLVFIAMGLSFKTQPDGLKPIALKELDRVKVNSTIYRELMVDKPFIFIMSPALDLIGYLNGEAVTLLKRKVGNREYSLTIPQSTDLQNAILYSKEN